MLIPKSPFYARTCNRASFMTAQCVSCMVDEPSHLDRIFLRALKYSIASSRGGVMRARILKCLLQKHLNTLAVANALHIDYKTSQYHLEKLLAQNLVIKNGDGYGSTYTPTFTPAQREAFEEMTRNMGESL